MKISVHIEESLCRTVEVEVATDNADEAMEIAEAQAIDDYKNGKIVLTVDDYNGITQVMTETESGHSTGWREI